MSRARSALTCCCSAGEEVSRWNLRKCSAAGLDVLATVFAGARSLHLHNMVDRETAAVHMARRVAANAALAWLWSP